METLEFKTRLFSLPIKQLSGNELIYIGMPLDELNSLLWDHFAVSGEQKNDGFCLFYNIKLEETIRLTLDILKQQVYRIEFLNRYKGKFDTIGIGSTIEELCAIKDNVFFDEQYVLVGSYPYDFILEIDNSGSNIYNLQDVLSNTITKIIVENKEILK